MGFLCKLFGHRYEHCRCTRCGAQRDEGHVWVEAEGKCEHTCEICGKTESVPHDWFHCRCKRCEEQRDEHHLWLKHGKCEQVCRICGEERQTHDWRHADRGLDRCAACGKTHRLTAEEIAKRDEEWSATDEYADEFADLPDEPPEQD